MRIVERPTRKEIMYKLRDARRELKRVVKENEEHIDDLDEDVMEMAEEAAMVCVKRYEEDLFIYDHKYPVYWVFDIPEDAATKKGDKKHGR